MFEFQRNTPANKISHVPNLSFNQGFEMKWMDMHAETQMLPTKAVCRSFARKTFVVQFPFVPSLSEYIIAHSKYKLCSMWLELTVNMTGQNNN